MKQAADGEAYRLEPLTDAEILRWDEIVDACEGRQLFHRRAWLDYLAESRGLEVCFLAIRQGSETLGYFCGGLLKMGPFRILGSPLRGWGTNFMGPVATAEIDQGRLLDAIDVLALKRSLALLEIEHPSLAPLALEAAGFEVSSDWTYIVRLTPGDETSMWQTLDSTCRNRIRKATKAGLVCDDVDDPSFVDEYYAQYSALMRRKQRIAPFPKTYPKILFETLKKADALFTLRVRDAEGRVLATGFFPHDDQTMYFWSGASWEESHRLCPNDYMHWQAMCLAARRGLRVYNMSGHGRFKRKFGGELAEVRRWSKCYWRSARWARAVYEQWVLKLSKAQGWWQDLTRSPVRGYATTVRPMAASSGRGTSFALNRSTRAHRRPPLRISEIWHAPLHDFPIRDEILYQHLEFSRTMAVLEVGPGSGLTASRVAQEVRTLTLLDVAYGNIRHLQRTLGHFRNVQFVCADVCKPQLDAVVQERFDAAYALEVFELLPDPAECLRNLAALLRPGGTLLLQFPNYPPPRSPGMTHFRTRDELEALLGLAGFRNWETHAIRMRPYAQALYTHFHERPLERYRRLRQGQSAQERPLTYDDSWAFQHGQRLERYKYAVHTAWVGLALAMRAGGECFERRPLGRDILNHNLVILARR
jgi:2-polyprenyl-3-methyl-5-hydroxy-6-metoxy-1,4-benzoquinol methylase